MNNFIKFLVFVMVFTMSLGVMAPNALAGDLAVNINVGSLAATLDTTLPVEDQSAAEVAAAPTEVYVVYQASGNFAADDTVNIVASTGLTIANTCATPTTDADNDTAADGAAVISGNTYTYTFTAATTEAATSVAFCINVTAGATGNYSFIVGDSNGDSGAGMLYIDDDNDVNVIAEVGGEELEFSIRTAADDGDTNACDLGTLTTGSVATCNYRLKVHTTASDGYSISWTSDGGLDSGGTATIDAVAVSTAVTAGNEQYGVQFYPGAVTGTGSCTAQNIWGAGFEDPVSTTPQTLSTCTSLNEPGAGPDLANTALMDHKAAINAGTPAGSYTQTVTYYVTATF